ncbi:alpha/beta hydrolase [Pedobacter sp. AW31-3R]|uniref:alpha/beta hydrolase n=1 Tax=Pedobacter sp. AW31-3R TaxID=3445781 RepID=UPI003FA0A3EC
MDFQALKYIYKPAEDKAAYTLLLLHGTGGNEEDLIPLAAYFGNNINILSVRGNVSEHGMPRFFKRLGMGIFDEADLKFRTEELLHFLNEAAVKEGFDPHKIIALGYSNGANIAGSVLVNHPGYLSGAVLLRPMQPYKVLPEIKNGNAVPVFLSSGKSDPTVSVSETTFFNEALNAGGYQSTLHLANASHGLVEEDLKIAADWFAKNFS